MIHVNKFSVLFFIIAVIAMYLQNIYVEALALFLTYIFHYRYPKLTKTLVFCLVATQEPTSSLQTFGLTVASF